MSFTLIASAVPLWAVFGFTAALFSASQMVLAERFKAPPFAMAFWVKAACVLAMLPFVAATGLPDNPVYYGMLAAQCLLWAVSDVIFCRGINDVGAGVISRVLPIATLASFFLWFFVDWPLARAYIANPVHSGEIVFVLLLLSFFAWNLRQCTITRRALRVIWFVLFANIVGTVTTKIITQQTDISQGIFAYVFCEALIMVMMWTVYYAAMRPLPLKVMFGFPAMKSGLLVGCMAAGSIASTIYAVYHIDNPAYVSAVKYLNAVLIFFYNRMTGKANQGHVWAGLGIVACAAALIILKSQP